jgi:long-subunit fatty acid transport protein
MFHNGITFPESFSFGVGYKPTTKLSLEVDTTETKWSLWVPEYEFARTSFQVHKPQKLTSIWSIAKAWNMLPWIIWTLPLGYNWTQSPMIEELAITRLTQEIGTNTH